MKPTLVKKVPSQKPYARLYTNENVYCFSEKDNLPADMMGALDGLDLGDDFDWDLAKWYWHNYPELFFNNIWVRCFNG